MNLSGKALNYWMQQEKIGLDHVLIITDDLALPYGKLRLKGKGVPNVERYGTGDLLVHVNVWTPKNVSGEVKKFFESHRDSDIFQPNPSKEDKSFFDKVKDMFSQ